MTVNSKLGYADSTAADNAKTKVAVGSFATEFASALNNEMTTVLGLTTWVNVDASNIAKSAGDDVGGVGEDWYVLCSETEEWSAVVCAAGIRQDDAHTSCGGGEAEEGTKQAAADAAEARALLRIGHLSIFCNPQVDCVAVAAVIACAVAAAAVLICLWLDEARAAPSQPVGLDLT